MTIMILAGCIVLFLTLLFMQSREALGWWAELVYKILGWIGDRWRHRE